MILAMFQQFDNIEAIFTTHEEDTMEGALTIPTNLIQANKLINLDSEDDKYVTIGCNGGTSIDGVFSIATTSELSGFTPVTISITGGLGGHSGVDIHKGRCNTLKSIFYLLFRVKNEITSNTMLIHDVQRIGTIADNAIPSDASCQLYIPTANKNEIINCMQEVFANDIKPLYPLENALQISITNDSFSSTNALDLTSSNLLINNINFAPDGMYKYNEQYKMSDQSTNF
jgi:dipeptidase D